MEGLTIDPLLRVEYLIPLAALLLAFGVFAAWRSSELCRRGLRIAFAALRLLGIACLILVAFNPGRWETAKQDRETEWAILVDRSASMAAVDVGGRTRWEEAVRLAQKAAKLSTTPARIHLFSGDLESSVSAAQMLAAKPDGVTTDIAGAGRTLFAQTARQKLNGVLLISDGGQNASTPADALAIRALAAGSPIYTLPVGGAIARKDLSLFTGTGLPVGFAGQPLRLKVDVKNEGLGNITPVIELLDGTGAKLAQQSVPVANDSRITVTFEVVPEKAGFTEYRIRTAPWPGEQIEGNNEARIDANVLSGKIRIFLAEGVPYWDSKFLVQLLRSQPNLEVTSVYRLASERFFKLETDVSKASNASEATFPDDPEELSKYDIVVFGKGVEYFLNPARIERLRAFVREQGGSVVFARGKPYSGTFADLEPLEAVEWNESVGGEFKFKPVRAGQEAGLFGTLLAAHDDPKWQEMPPLQNGFSVKLKAFAQTLAEGTLEAGGQERSFPVVVSRRYGKGLISVINADGLWNWDFFPSASDAGETYKTFWPQLLQWAATGSDFLPGQNYSIRLNESRVAAGVPARAHIKSRVTTGDRPAPKIRVSQDGKPVQEISAARSADSTEEWDAVIAVPQPGSYRVDVLGEAGERAASCRLFVTTPPTDKDDLSANPEFLAKLAADSGGKQIAEADLADTLKPRTEAEPEPGKMNWLPFWDRAGLLLIMLGCFGTEWFLRRRNGLI